jgi:hypothetical protein
MNEHDKRVRWRFSLRTLILTVFAVGVTCAATLTRQEPQLMWRFSEADGGGAIYGTSIGWPWTYLRMPVGDYAHVPADLFAPGLIADLAFAAMLIAMLVFAWKSVGRARAARKQNIAKSC